MTNLLLTHGSYLLIGLVLVLTGAGLPVPEEVPIITAGIMAGHGQLNPWLAFVACLLGALTGDCLMYYIGYHFGRSVVREHRYWARLVTPQREAQMEEMISRHGLKALFLARFLVGLRSPVYLAAGILRVPFRRFFLFDLFCATAVIGTFFTLSYYYGQTITHWIRRAEIAITVAVVLAVVTLGVYLWRVHRRRAARASPQSERAEPQAPLQPEAEKAGETEHIEHVA
jgi:membrane protein DedA with SNARE-associated domain